MYGLPSIAFFQTFWQFFKAFFVFWANPAMFFWNQPSQLPELFLTNPLRVR